MKAASSDLHLGNNGYRDRSQRELLLRTVATICEPCYQVTDWYHLGDTFERSKFSLNAIVSDEDNVALMRFVAEQLNRAHIALHLLPGNHDPDVMEFLPWLLNVCGFHTVIMHKEIAWAGVWRLSHGSEFDDVCGAWFAPIARGMTWFTGNTIERAFPMFPESIWNPVSWFSPRASDDDRAGAVGVLMRDFARTNALHLLAGHTHRPDVEGGANDNGDNWVYVNTGAMSDGARWSLALFDDNGDYEFLGDAA